MQIITKQTTIRWVKQRLKHGNFKQITLLTFKKDRQIIINDDDGLFSLDEQGYQQVSYTDLDQQAVIKLLRKLLVVEFPRSHTIYVQIIEK